MSPPLSPNPLFLFFPLSLSPLLFVSATHARSRGYVVEPPRGHRIIIGWQVTRTLSPGFNWPIIVARIDGAAGPDRRETFGVACSPSDTTRLSVTNISWQEGANVRADRGIQGKEAGMGEGERERVAGKGQRMCMGIEKGRSRGSRVDMCANSARTVVPRTCTYLCTADGRVESGSESGARTGANWSRLVCPISVPSAPPPLVPLAPPPSRPSLAAARSLYQPLSPSHPTVVLHVYLAN